MRVGLVRDIERFPESDAVITHKEAGSESDTQRKDHGKDQFGTKRRLPLPTDPCGIERHHSRSNRRGVLGNHATAKEKTSCPCSA